MKIAIDLDRLTSLWGGERVLKAMLELYPQAEEFTPTCNLKNEKILALLKGHKVNFSWLQKIPWASKKHQFFPMLRPYAVEAFDLGKFDVVLSSSYAESKGVITKENTLHISYCHTPTRYYWSDYHDYFKRLEFGILNPLARLLMPYFIHHLRIWDRLASDRVDFFIANSNFVKERIKKYYQREAEVIFPPVDTGKFQIYEKPDEYFLAVGRLVSYKKFDLIVKAFNDLWRPLKIIGRWPELKNLQKIAKSNIEIISKFLPDKHLYEIYGKCKAFILPQIEDFGIVPIEAMSAGRPVIAYRGWGALDYIQEGINGLFFNEQTPQCLIDTLKKFKVDIFNPEKIRQKAIFFDVSNFKRKLRKLVEDKYREYQDWQKKNIYAKKQIKGVLKN